MARQALALDPLGVTRYLNLARILIGGGRYDEAEAALRKAVALQPAAARLHVLSHNDRCVTRQRRRPRCKMHSSSRQDSGRITRWLWRGRRRVIAPRPMLHCKS